MVFEGVWMDEGGGGGVNNTPATPTPPAPPEGGEKKGEVVFEEWVTGQDEQVKGMLEKHVAGLKSALTSERESRKKLEKELRDLAGKAEKGSETQAALEKLANEQGELERKADFYEAAHGAGVNNLKLAYLVAVQEGLMDAKGRVNWEGLKGSYPELFRMAAVKPPAGNAGNGTGDQKLPGKSMNDFIRVAAGRKI